MHASRSGPNGSMAALRDPSALCRMLESGLDKSSGGKGAAGGGGGGDQTNQQQGATEQEAKPLTRLEEIRRAERLDKMYDAVRKWLRAHSSNPNTLSSSLVAAVPADPALRHAAATHSGLFGMTPLHLLCKLPNPPVDIVADLIECAPETLQWSESSGWLPIHLAVASGANLAVLEMLCDAYPDGKIAQDRRLRTPLHFGK
jgi:hypothetical protein